MASSSDVPKKHSRNRCSFTGCERSKARHPTLKFYSFPVKRPEVCEIWISNCANESLVAADIKTLDRKVVCEKHFADDSFQSTLRTRLHCCAVPTIVSLADSDDETDAVATTSKSVNETPLDLEPTPPLVCQSLSVTSDDQPVVPNQKALFSAPSSVQDPCTPPYKKLKRVNGRKQTPKNFVTPEKKRLIDKLNSARIIKQRFQQKVKGLENKPMLETKDMLMPAIKDLLADKVSNLVCMQRKHADKKKLPWTEKENQQALAIRETKMATSEPTKRNTHTRRAVCSFLGCCRSMNKYPGLHFFKFPVTRPAVCEAWVRNCSNEDLDFISSKTLNTRVVCGKHFEDSCFLNSLKNKLSKSAVPTLLALEDDDPPSSVASQEELREVLTPITKRDESPRDDNVKRPFVESLQGDTPPLHHAKATPSTSMQHEQNPWKDKKFKRIIGLKPATVQKYLTPRKKVLLEKIKSARKLKRKYQHLSTVENGAQKVDASASTATNRDPKAVTNSHATVPTPTSCQPVISNANITAIRSTNTPAIGSTHPVGYSAINSFATGAANVGNSAPAYMFTNTANGAPIISVTNPLPTNALTAPGQLPQHVTSACLSDFESLGMFVSLEKIPLKRRKKTEEKVITLVKLISALDVDPDEVSFSVTPRR